MSEISPTLMPLGDRAILVKFSSRLDDTANNRAISLARRLNKKPPFGALEITSNLVSVFVQYDCQVTTFEEISSALRLLLSIGKYEEETPSSKQWHIPISYGGKQGPDLHDLCDALNLTMDEFIAMHQSAPLRVLTTGFAPGFVYCGFHRSFRDVPRRPKIHNEVPAGSILFAAGQTAIAATPIPTGWHVIGLTDFSNFNASKDIPTKLSAGDEIIFTPVDRL